MNNVINQRVKYTKTSYFLVIIQEASTCKAFHSSTEVVHKNDARTLQTYTMDVLFLGIILYAVQRNSG